MTWSTVGDRADELAEVKQYLRARGASDETVERAAAQGVLGLLVTEYVLDPSGRRYTRSDMEELTGVGVDTLLRFWRALGFPDVEPTEKAFTDLDVEAITILGQLLDTGLTDLDSAVQMARVMGSCMTRIAEAELSMARDAVEHVDDLTQARQLTAADESLVQSFARLLEYAWRRHLAAATRRRMALRSQDRSGSPASGSLEMAVGFADMVGFTALSQQLSREELARVVTRFEDVAHGIVTALGGRVVKMIGDEAMFVVEDIEAAARMSLDLAEAYADDELLSDVRIGLCVGPVLAMDGDYYGPVVNMASRMVNIANPGSVLVSDEVHARLKDSEELVWRSLKPRYLKDIGRVHMWAMMRLGRETSVAQRRLGERWQRISTNLTKDLGELRERGERLLSTTDEHLSPS